METFDLVNLIMLCGFLLFGYLLFYFTMVYRKREQHRDEISYKTLEVGMVLRVYPAARSHHRTPYNVVVVENTETYFRTFLHDGKPYDKPHVRTFKYSRPEWSEYHCNRFKIIGKLKYLPDVSTYPIF